MRLLPVAAAVALLLPLTNVFALALGRISVQSSLGEPLRAEVEVTQITPEEAASLRAAPAALEAFRAAGIERHPALAELRVSPERLSNGRFIIRLSSDRVINEPVIDLLLEASWSAGRIVRDYTLLFDPPANRAEASTTPGTPTPPASAVPAQLPPLPQAAGLAPGESTAAPGATSPSAAASATPPASTPAASAPIPTQAASAPATTRVTVKPGDTAGRLVAVGKPASVSLEQMLVALLRANPDAFVGNNMNRLKAGAVLEMPAAETAATVEAREARRTVIAQSQDFNEFRRRLAEATAARPEGAAPGAGPTDAGPAASRRATGRVEARVEEKGRRPADATPDRLTLSKGAVQGQASASAAAAASAASKASSADAQRTANEDRIARQRAEQEASQRQSELERNIAELNRLNAGVAGARPPGSAASAAGVALNLPASPASAASGPAASTPAAAASEAASAPAEAASDAPAAAASSAQAPASTPAKAASGAANVRTGLADRLLAALGDRVNQPWTLAIGAAVLAGLAAIGGLLWWSRRKPAGSAAPTPAPTPTRPGTQASGEPGDGAGLARGAERAISSYNATGSDTQAETDPLAEADVYLAYGRDLQAEEVLQEALRATPDRLPVIVKLLEVFARRFDWDAFEPLARRARTLTGAQGRDWARVVELGASLAPIGHPLFSANAKDAGPGAAGLDEPFGAGAFASAPSYDPSPPSAGAAGLDRRADVPAGLDLDIEGFRMPTPAPDASRAAAPAPDAEIDALFEDDLGPRTDNYRASPIPPGAAMDFDLAGLSLDLNKPAGDAGAAADPLATKLALAEEFLSIGDTEGARSLAEEVRVQASGDLRARAERLLTELG